MDITGIGSVPFTDIAKAIDFSLKFSLPFLPELPLLTGQSFMDQAKRDFSFYAQKDFIKQCQERKFSRIKVQLAAPQTLMNNQNKYCCDELYERFYQRVISLSRTYDNILFCIDAPDLFRWTEEEVKKMVSFLESFKIDTFAIHCCGKLQEDFCFSLFPSSFTFFLDMDLNNHLLEKMEKHSFFYGSDRGPYQSGKNCIGYTSSCGYAYWSEKECVQSFESLSSLL